MLGTGNMTFKQELLFVTNLVTLTQISK